MGFGLKALVHGIYPWVTLIVFLGLLVYLAMTPQVLKSLFGAWYSFLLSRIAQCGEFYIYVAASMSVYSILINNSFYSIFKATSGKRLKQRLSIFMNVLYPITLYTLAVTLWLASPYSYVLKEEHYILFVVTVGILFGLMASNIILAHLTKSPFPSFAGILGTLWLLVSLIAVVPSITGW